MLRIAGRSVATFALPLVLFVGPAPAPAPSPSRVGAVKVVILSTMLADAGIGEWGFAALVEADGHRILFDTGARPDTVLQNARELKIDLSAVTDVVLSHHHGDHTGGLVALRREYAKANPAALSRAFVGRGIFLPRAGGRWDGPPPWKAAYEAQAGRFVELDQPCWSPCSGAGTRVWSTRSRTRGVPSGRRRSTPLSAASTSWRRTTPASIGPAFACGRWASRT